MLIARNASTKDLFDSPFLILYGLGMGLLCLGAQKEADLIIETTQIQEFSPDLQLILRIILSSCAYAGSGNVLKVQELMQLVAKTKEEINPKIQVNFFPQLVFSSDMYQLNRIRRRSRNRHDFTNIRPFSSIRRRFCKTISIISNSFIKV